MSPARSALNTRVTAALHSGALLQVPLNPRILVQQEAETFTVEHLRPH